MATSIAVLEDDLSFGDLVALALARQGYEVTWYASTGAAASDLAKNPPDLTLVEVGLLADGFSLCLWLRNTYPDMPIVLLTSPDAALGAVLGRRCGAPGHATEPFSMTVLLARVRAHLHSVETPDPGAPSAPQG